MSSVGDLQLQGVVNSAVDILSRRIIQSIVYYDVRMHVISSDLIGLLCVELFPSFHLYALLNKNAWLVELFTRLKSHLGTDGSLEHSVLP